MRLLRLPALVLAIALQMAPVCRLACLNHGGPTAGYAIVYKCLLGAVALLGTYHAVSAASAAIAGVSSTSPIGPVTTNATGTVGQPFSYRIIVTNPGKDHSQDFWNAAPLPPGLTINTNIGGNGWITGTPTTAGSYPVTLTAGNANSVIVVHKDITIAVQGTGTSPPSITGPPTNQIVSAGTTVTFTVAASGGDLTYQWRFNGTNLANANAAALTLSSVTTNQSGFYSVMVSNSASSTVSGDAQLLVVPPPDLGTAPSLGLLTQAAGQIALSFAVAPGYRYIVETTDTLTPGSWVQLTNVPPSYVGSSMTLPQGVTTPARRFYRVQVTTN